MEIGGAFLRVPGEPPEYAGAAVLKARGLTLSAFGSYADVGCKPSFFVYAVLDYALGGPSFFRVTGLAAAFGYDRALRVPAFDEIADFALVRAAMDPGWALGTGTDKSKASPGLQQLGDAVRPAVGSTFSPSACTSRRSRWWSPSRCSPWSSGRGSRCASSGYRS